VADQALVGVQPAATVVVSQADSDEMLARLWLHGWTANTAAAYTTSLAQFQAAIGLPLHQVTLGALQGWADSLAEQGLSPATRAARLGAIKSLFAFGLRLGYLPVDVSAALRLPKLRDKLSERILLEEQVQRMLAVATEPVAHALVRLIYVCGVRISEAVALRWTDLVRRQSGGQATVFGKGGKTRAVLIPMGLWKELAALRSTTQPDEAVISHVDGRPLSRSLAHRLVKRVAERAGVPAASAHWLRHSHISHALDNGCSSVVVRDTAGHASLTTTSRYAHARPGQSSSTFIREGKP